MNHRVFGRGRCLTVMALVGVLGGVVVGASEIERLSLGGPRGLELASARAGEFYDAEACRVVSFEEVVQRLSDADVVLIGEDHTHLAQKELHAKLLEALVGQGGVPVLGMEFFLKTDDEALERWVDGVLHVPEFLHASGWLSRGIYNWEYYRGVMEVARTHELRVVGLNIPRSVVRTVSRSGLDALTDEQRAFVGDVGATGSPEHRYLFERYLGDAVAKMPSAWLDRMFAAQCLWDGTMARSILEALPEGGQVVAIAGSGHVVYRLGIAQRVQDEARRRGLREIRVVTVAPATAPPGGGKGMHGHPTGGPMHQGESAGPRFMPAVFSRSYADIVAVFGDSGGLEAYPRLSLGLEEEGGGVTVGRIWPDSLAERLGFRTGDHIISLGGWRKGSVEDLRLELFGLRWWSPLHVEIVRGETEVSIDTVIVPDIEASERELVAGWSMVPLDGFDPDSGLSVGEGLGEKTGVHDALYEDPQGTRRVVRRVDGTAAAVFVLDENGAVSEVIRSRSGEEQKD